MKARLMGTEDECAALVQVLRDAPTVQVVEVSTPYPNRGASDLVRVYVELRAGAR